jgi:ATP-dependent protease HslVU (ClpYQ) peptidase subunit
MTCIIGLKYNGTVYLGGDSAGVDVNNISIRADEKVFSNGPFIMGFSGSFRMGQLLQWSFRPPRLPKSRSIFGYLVTDFIDALRKCYQEKGTLKSSESGCDMGDQLLLGIHDELYHIQSDFQVAEVQDAYNSIGSGMDVSLGAMYATEDIENDPEYRIRVALEAAAKHITSVAPPFLVIDSASKKVRAL